jgi:hypothetical protein
MGAHAPSAHIIVNLITSYEVNASFLYYGDFKSVDLLISYAKEISV